MNIRPIVIVYILLLALFATTAAIASVSSSPPGYSYVKSHIISGSTDGDLNDYQVALILHSGSGTDGGQDVYLNGHSSSWPNDIRFTDSDDNLLSYWVESNDSNTAKVWVKVPDIPASPGAATIYLFYGKQSDSGESNIDGTFLFGDDFSGNTLDANKWMRADAGTGNKSLAVSDGNLTFSASNAGIRLEGANSFSTPVVIETSLLVNGPPYKNVRVRLAGSAVNADPCGFDIGLFSTYIPMIYWNGYAGPMFSFNTRYRSIETFIPSRSYAWSIAGLASNQEGTSLASISPCLGVGDYPVVTWSKICGSMTVDWVFVRKYAQHEPSHGAWGKETSAKIRAVILS